MSETRKQLIDALMAHAMHFLDGTGFEPIHQEAGVNYEQASKKVGDFFVSHTRSTGWQGMQLLDIWHGRKVFALRKEGPQTDWKLVRLQRGDWESAFLLAA